MGGRGFQLKVHQIVSWYSREILQSQFIVATYSHL